MPRERGARLEGSACTWRSPGTYVCSAADINRLHLCFVQLRCAGHAVARQVEDHVRTLDGSGRECCGCDDGCGDGCGCGAAVAKRFAARDPRTLQTPATAPSSQMSTVRHTVRGPSGTTLGATKAMSSCRTCRPGGCAWCGGMARSETAASAAPAEELRRLWHRTTTALAFFALLVSPLLAAGG